MLRESIAKFFKVESLIQHLTGYVETRVELLKVEAREELAKGLSGVVVFLLLAFVFAVMLIFLSIAVALALGENIGYFGGFAIVAACYLLIGIGVASVRESLTRKIEKKILTMFNKKKE